MTLALWNGAWAFAAQASTLLTLGLLASWALRRRPARAHAALLAAALACAAAPLLWGGAQQAGVGLWEGRPAVMRPGIAREAQRSAVLPEPAVPGFVLP